MITFRNVVCHVVQRFFKQIKSLKTFHDKVNYFHVYNMKIFFPTEMIWMYGIVGELLFIFHIYQYIRIHNSEHTRVNINF